MAGCALDTGGQYNGDALIEIGDSAEEYPDVLELEDTPIAEDVLDEHHVDTIDADGPDEFEAEAIDADAPDEFVTDSADAPDESGSCVGNLSPRSFHLLSPLPDAGDVSTMPAFSWGIASDPEAGPVICALTVDDNEDFSSPVLVRSVPQLSGATENNYSFLPADPSLEFGTPYWWQVDCSDPCGNSRHAELSPRSFTTREYPICSKIGPDVRVTNDGGDSGRSSLAWTGRGYGVSWDDDRVGNAEIYVSGISETGVPIGSDFRVTNAAGGSWSSSLVWNGSVFEECWHDYFPGNSEIYCSQISEDCSSIGSIVRLTNDIAGSYWPSLVSNGSGFAVSWHDNRSGSYQIYLNFLSGMGVPLGSNIRITNSTGSSQMSSLDWTGARYGVCWEDDHDGNKEIYCSIVSDIGALIASDIRITDDIHNSRYPALAWNGAQHVVAWEDDRNGNKDIYLAYLSATGVVTSPNIQITFDPGNSSKPALVCTGTECGVAWEDDRHGDQEIFFAYLPAGGLIGEEVRVTNAAGDSVEPSLVWNGSGFAASWSDNRDGNNEIYFAGIGCEP